MNLAYITTAVNAQEVQGAQFLYNSYANTNSKYPFFVVSNNPIENLRYVKKDEIKATDRNDYTPHPMNQEDTTAYNKLNAWTLTDYDYVMFLSNDGIITENLDEYFESLIELMGDNDLLVAEQLDDGGVMLDGTNFPRLTSTWFIAKPNITIFNLLKENIDSSVSEENLFYNLWDSGDLKVKILEGEENLISLLNNLSFAYPGEAFAPHKYWECAEGLEYYNTVIADKYAINDYLREWGII